MANADEPYIDNQTPMLKLAAPQVHPNFSSLQTLVTFPACPGWVNNAYFTIFNAFSAFTLASA